jgi:hypothetical protein
MSRQIAKQEPNTTALSKAEEHRNLRAHLLMMLEAMQYKGSIKHLGNTQLRELVEEQKLVFLRKYEKELQEQNG